MCMCLWLVFTKQPLVGWLKFFWIEFKAETGANYSGKHFWAEQCVHVPLACLKLKLGPFTVVWAEQCVHVPLACLKLKLGFKDKTGAFCSGKHFWAEQCVHVPLACLKLKLGPFTVVWAEQCVHVPLACLKLKLGPFTAANISGLNSVCMYLWLV